MSLEVLEHQAGVTGARICVVSFRSGHMHKAPQYSSQAPSYSGSC